MNRIMKRLLLPLCALLSAPAWAVPPGSAPPVDLSPLKANAKLLRPIAAATISNSVINLPWTAPPACPASTAVAVGFVCANAGGWYMVGIAGTTGASSPPTTTTSGAYIADGTASYTYLGGARITANDANAPTLTSVTSNPGGAAYRPGTTPTAFRVLGAATTLYNTYFWKLVSFTELGSVAAERGASVAFTTESAKPSVFIPSNSQCVRIIVDSRYLQPGCFNFGGTDTWVTIDWTAKDGRRPRNYEVECGKSACQFGGVYVSTLDTVRPTTYSDDVRVVWDGDSIIGGGGSSYGPWLAGNGMGVVVGKMLGHRDVWNLATGGSGLLANNSGATYTFRGRVAQGCALNPDLWFQQAGSSNDIGQSSSAITAEMTATLLAIRACYSGPIIAVGVPSINANTPTVETAAMAAVTAAQASDPRIFAIPISTAASPYVTGSWNSTISFSNNAPFCVGGDATHPPEIAVSECYGRNIAADFRSIVVPKLAVQ